MRPIAAAILASTFIVAGAAPALASGEDPSDTASLAACGNLGERPSNVQVRDCVTAAARFIESHREMIKQAVREVRANEAAIRDAQQEIEANRGAILEAQRELRSEMDEVRDAVREVRQSAEALRDAERGSGRTAQAEPPSPDQPPPSK